MGFDVFENEFEVYLGLMDCDDVVFLLYIGSGLLEM